MLRGSPRFVFRLHRGTWVATLFVVIALAWCQAQGELANTPPVKRGYWNQTHHGWPLRAVERNHRGVWVDGQVGRFAYGTPHVSWAVRPLPLAFDAVCWLALLAGTAFACEDRLRQVGGVWQVRLADLLLWTAVAAVLLAGWRWDALRFAGSEFDRGAAELLRMDARSPFRGSWAPWFIRLPLLFATACAIYAVLRGALRTVAGLSACVTSHSPLAPANDRTA